MQNLVKSKRAKDGTRKDSYAKAERIYDHEAEMEWVYVQDQFFNIFLISAIDGGRWNLEQCDLFGR